MSRVARTSRNLLLVAAAVLVLVVVSGVVAMQTQPAVGRSVRTLAWEVVYKVFPVKGQDALAALHTDASTRPREQCVGCHGDKQDSKLLLHRIHLTSPLLPDIACHECHRKVDLSKRGNYSVVTWVDVAFCKKCHSEFPGLRPGSKMRPADFQADCTKCHTGKRAPRHAREYLARNMPASECKGCHGGRVLPWTPAHSRSDWLKRHGAEALRVGSDACFQCHDFGLKFCDDCHTKKPPSHLPAEKWRARHPEAARADTRVCYSCHRTSFCKKCHLNHEDGWLERHPEVVFKKGDDSCRECHSESACGFCHTEATMNSGSTTPGVLSAPVR